MIVSKGLMVILLSLSLCMQVLAAVEAKEDNSTEERLAQLENKLEILTSKMKSSEVKVAELVETKTNAIEERLASLEASMTESQSIPAACKYQFLYQYEKEAPHSSADSEHVAKLQSELTRLQEKVSALDKCLHDNDLRVDTLYNASVLAIEGMLHSMRELMAASEQNLKSTMENTIKYFYEGTASMMNDTKAHLLARADNTMAVVNASFIRVEQTTKELATRVSTVEDNLHNATSLHAEEVEKTGAMLEDLKNTTKERCKPPQYRRTCQDYYDNGQRSSGTYSLLLEDGQKPMEVYCNMTNGTGWVVFQRREDGSVDFYRNWKSYEEGFGDLEGEFWLGNRNIHRLTRAGLTQLTVDLQVWNGSSYFASYSHFSVGNARSFYKLSVSGYSGTAGDSLSHNSGNMFTTNDRDQDTYRTNCAQIYKGAWWYYSCSASNLNGEYGTRGSSGWQYAWWRNWLGLQSLQRTELKLK